MNNCICCICSDALLDGNLETISTHCGHVFHEKCMTTWLQCNETCPKCRRETKSDSLIKLYFNDDQSECSHNEIMENMCKEMDALTQKVTHLQRALAKVEAERNEGILKECTLENELITVKFELSEIKRKEKKYLEFEKKYYTATQNYRVLERELLNAKVKVSQFKDLEKNCEILLREYNNMTSKLDTLSQKELLTVKSQLVELKIKCKGLTEENKNLTKKLKFFCNNMTNRPDTPNQQEFSTVKVQLQELKLKCDYLTEENENLSEELQFLSNNTENDPDTSNQKGSSTVKMQLEELKVKCDSLTEDNKNLIEELKFLGNLKHVTSKTHKAVREIFVAHTETTATSTDEDEKDIHKLANYCFTLKRELQNCFDRLVRLANELETAKTNLSLAREAARKAEKELVDLKKIIIKSSAPVL